MTESRYAEAGYRTLIYTYFFLPGFYKEEKRRRRLLNVALENLTGEWNSENLIQQLRLLGTLTQDYIVLGCVAQKQIQKLDVLFRVLLLVPRGLRELASSFQWRNRLSRE